MRASAKRLKGLLAGSGRGRHGRANRPGDGRPALPGREGQGTGGEDDGTCHEDDGEGYEERHG